MSSETTNPLKKVKLVESYCSYCKKDTSNACRVKCVDCSSSYESCVDCFAAGAALFPHVATHRYTISDCLDFPLFSKDWTAREDLLLLEGD
jgi:transcriptional adapter 2-alpha